MSGPGIVAHHSFVDKIELCCWTKVQIPPWSRKEGNLPANVTDQERNLREN